MWVQCLASNQMCLVRGRYISLSAKVNMVDDQTPLEGRTHVIVHCKRGPCPKKWGVRNEKLLVMHKAAVLRFKCVKCMKSC